MKKACIFFLIVSIIILSVIGINQTEQVEKEYLRIHIRANSNTNYDQSVKYLVKDAVVEYLTPFIAQCDTKEKATKTLTDNLKGVEKVANRVLSAQGFNYTSKASIREEEFPLRTYDDLVLEAGFYQALIIELGEGTGDNWWCVVYPPLCFVGKGTNYIYKSKLLEIINSFTNKK